MSERSVESTLINTDKWFVGFTLDEPGIAGVTFSKKFLNMNNGRLGSQMLSWLERYGSMDRFYNLSDEEKQKRIDSGFDVNLRETKLREIGDEITNVVGLPPTEIRKLWIHMHRKYQGKTKAPFEITSFNIKPESESSFTNYLKAVKSSGGQPETSR